MLTPHPFPLPYNVDTYRVTADDLRAHGYNIATVPKTLVTDEGEFELIRVRPYGFDALYRRVPPSKKKGE